MDLYLHVKIIIIIHITQKANQNKQKKKNLAYVSVDLKPR